MSEIACLGILLDRNKTRLEKPSWFELRNFVNFADSQLSKLEKMTIVDHIKEFRGFCLKLCCMMFNNFGLPSLDIALDTDNDNGNHANFDHENNFQMQLERLRIRDDRRWESLVRPYFVMNADGFSLTMIGSYLNRYLIFF